MDDQALVYRRTWNEQADASDASVPRASEQPRDQDCLVAEGKIDVASVMDQVADSHLALAERVKRPLVSGLKVCDRQFRRELAVDPDEQPGPDALEKDHALALCVGTDRAKRGHNASNMVTGRGTVRNPDSERDDHFARPGRRSGWDTYG
jgi:hypothetical protein